MVITSVSSVLVALKIHFAKYPMLDVTHQSKRKRSAPASKLQRKQETAWLSPKELKRFCSLWTDSTSTGKQTVSELLY